VTEHTPVVVDPYVTLKPDDAVAVSAGGVLENGVLGGCGKVIVFTPFVTLNERVTGEAASKLPLPGWFAAMVQVPADTNARLPPDVTVQTPVVEEL
jgi:hypothetical protein